MGNFGSARGQGVLMCNPGSDGGLGELLWERPLAAMRRMRTAGFV